MLETHRLYTKDLPLGRVLAGRAKQHFILPFPELCSQSLFWSAKMDHIHSYIYFIE